MAIAPSTTVLVLCVIGGIQHSLAQSQSIMDGPYGQDLLECKSEWDKISEDGDRVSECMQAFTWAAGLKLKEPEGIPALGIKTVEPVTIPELRVIDTPMIKGRFLDINMYNVSNYLQPGSTKITYDPATQIATSVTNAKEVHAFADYDFSANTGVFFNPGGAAQNGAGMTAITGKGEVIAYDAVNTLKMHMKRRKRGGLTISKVESSTVVGDLKIKATPSNPNDPFGPMINGFLNNKEMVTSVADKFIMPIFNKQVAQTVGSIFHKGWNKLEQL